MKKNFLLMVLAIFATTITAMAQFGIKAGVNLSSWTGSDADGFSSKVGYYGGLFYNAEISEAISVQPEVVFSSEGAKYSDYDETEILNYVNITPLVRYNSGGFFVGTGPQLGILTSAKAKYNGDTEDIKDYFKSTNFSWALAVGYELENGVGIYARYNLGLSSIADESNTTVKTSVFGLGLRYHLSPDKKEKK